MGARLGNASRGNIVIVLINGVLHLFQELINVDQIILGPDIGHGRQLVLDRMRAAVTITATATASTTPGRDHHWGRHGLVIRDRAAAEDRELQVLQAQEPLANSRVRVSIELASLQVPKELIEGVVAALLRLVRALARVMALVQSVIDIAVRGVRRLRGMRLVVLRGRMHITLTRDGVQRGLKVMVGTGGIACIRGKPSQSYDLKPGETT